MGGDLLLLLAGLALIVYGGESFVAASIRIAEFLRMPRVVIGSTLVSLGTTTPELVVSIMAGSRGESGLAVGNAVGSCLCNIGLILGLTAALRPVKVRFQTLQGPFLIMAGFGMLLFVFTLDLSLGPRQGWFLVVAGIGYFAWDFHRHWRVRDSRDRAEAAAIESQLGAVRWPWLRTRTGTGLQFGVGAGVVALGSRLLVEGASGVAAGLGIPSVVIGLTVVAIGTSLPELVTAVTSARRSASDLAVGNVLGANIANLSLIVGAAAALSPVVLDRWTQALNFPPLLGAMAGLYWLLWRRHGVTQLQGLALVGAYLGYLALVAGFASSARQ